MAVNVWQGVQQGQQLVDNLFRQRDQMQAGRALATGDYGSAMRALGAGGDIQGVRQIQADQVQAQQRQRATQEEDTGRQIAFTRQATAALRKAMTEGGDALATYDSMAPAFQQIGATPEQLQQYRQALAADPEGFLTNIERATAEAERKLSFQKAGNNVLVFEEGNPDPLRTFSAPREDYTLGQTRFSGLTNEPVAQAARPSEFIQVDPYKNLTEIPGTPPVGGGGRMTRGLRNNNPGNIEDGNFAKSLPGYKGSDGRFAIFETPEDGVNAGVKLLESYAGRGVVTPAQVINRWAPPSDNNPTQAYAKYVADRLGIGVNDPIPAERRSEAFQAINEFENGNRGPSQGGSPAPRVVAPASAQAETAILTAEEKSQLGLPEEGVFQRDRSGKITQVSGTQPRQEKFTEGQRSAAAFSYRTQQASNELRQLESQGIRTPSAQVLLGDGTLNTAIRSQTDRQFMQAARNWLAPILRKDTGAAVTDTEMVYYMDIYIPRPGDGPEVLAQKARARADAERALRAQAGRAYDEMFAGAPETTRQPRVRFALSPQQQAWVAQNGQAEGPGRTPRRAGSRENPRLINPANATQSYNNIPSGSYFLTPDGQLRQKR